MSVVRSVEVRPDHVPGVKESLRIKQSICVQQDDVGIKIHHLITRSTMFRLSTYYLVRQCYSQAIVRNGDYNRRAVDF